MAQNKLQRFADIKTFSNVLEYPQGMKGRWREVFGNDNPINLELACGKGEYAIGLATLYPQQNFIGVDVKGNRMWVGAKLALRDNLENVRFLRSLIEKISDYFAVGEVANIWITFPDPQLRGSKAKKRLTHPRFLKLYQSILKTTGVINLKTDSPDLYQFTLTVIRCFDFTLLQNVHDVYAGPSFSNELNIKTHYEQLDIAQSNKIHYLQFLPDKAITPEKEEVLKQLLSEAATN